MSKINFLPQNLINQIAAGEVIERPASVVKELVENSIDAGATKIEIKIKNGGLSEIDIVDNGSGIEEEDIEKAFSKHATSKIKTENDLFNINTLGFRGEALSSISSIAKVYLDTRTLESQVGVTCRIVNGKIEEKGLSNRQVGTTLIIQDIFYNIPARKKFLKSTNTEKNHILNEFYNLVLSHPDIEFKIEVDDKVLFEIQSLEFSEIESRVKTLFENQVQFIPFQEDTDEKFKLRGLVSHPNSVTNKKGLEYIFVNGRAVKDPIVRKAITSAYTGFIPGNFHPQFLIYIDLAPESVDVNVHPKKMEVRWEDTNAIFSRIHRTVKSVIERNLKISVKQSLQDDTDEFVSIPEIERQPIQFPINVESKFEFKPTTQNLSGLNTTFKPSSTEQTQKFLNFGKEIFSANIVQDSEPENVNDEQKIKLGYLNSYTIFDTYIILEYSEKIQLIDQHAAAERITFDKLKNKYKQNKTFEIQELLIPIPLNLKPNQKEILESLIPFFAKFNIVIDEFGRGEFVISAHPIELSATYIDKLIIEIIDEIISSGENFDSFLQLEKNVDKILASSACHNSIRAGYAMKDSEIRWLVGELFNTENPYSCPHGRPIIWELTKNDLEKKFGRIK